MSVSISLRLIRLWAGAAVSFSVSVLVQSTLAVPLLRRNSQRRRGSRRTRDTDGLPWLQVRSDSTVDATSQNSDVLFSDTMIDLGFVISSFVPLVLFWM